MNKKTIALLISLFLIISCGIIYYLRFWEREVIPVSISSVRLGEITKTFSSSGFLEASERAKISSEISGRVAQVYFEEGDRVKKGEPLVKFVSDELIAQLASAEAALAQAEATLSNVKTKFERTKRLFEKGFLAQEELEEIQTQYEVSRAMVEQKRSLVKDIEAKLAHTIITAPITGTVVKRYVREGEVVAGPIGLGGFRELTPIGEVANLKELLVHADVDETEIGKIRVGQRAKITVDAFPQKEYKGKVLEISRVPLEGTKVGVNYRVKIRISNPSPFLKLGMTANIEFISERKENILLLPQGAVQHKKKKSLVFVVNNSRVFLREIKTGIEDEEYIEVLSGLRLGERVVNGDLERLKEGQRARIVEEISYSKCLK